MVSVALLQAFDRHGTPLIVGESNINDHVNWLQLSSYALKGVDKLAAVAFPADRPASTGIWRDYAQKIIYDRAVIDFFWVPDDQGKSTWSGRVAFSEAWWFNLFRVDPPKTSTEAKDTFPLASGSLTYGHVAVTFRDPRADPVGLPLSTSPTATFSNWGKSLDGPSVPFLHLLNR
jgi:hypothetical protein